MLKRCTIIIFISLFITTSAIATEGSSQAIVASCHATPFGQTTPSDIAKFLGWVRDPKSCTPCGGSYVDSSNIKNTPNPKGMQETPMNVTSSKHAIFTQYGTSVAEGSVTLTQPGREISADCVTFSRDNKTGKLSGGVLVGHVHFHEYGRLIVAEQSNLNFVSEVHTLDNGFYRMLSNTPSGITNIWGQAKHTVRDAMGVLKMQRATYNSCPPDAASWHIWSNRLTLDRNAGRGEAFNALFFIKKVPVFYTPYFSFPLDKRRKSGFLFTVPSTSTDSGLALPLPYYFNLAPNYDATFTPTFFTKRGILLGGLFNYLTPATSGNVNVNYIPHDRAFINFRDKSYPVGHASSVLQNASASRGFLSLQNDLRLNDHWKGSLTGKYTTDDYFLQDFGSVDTINEDQLFNQAEINYTSASWRFSSRVQEFQTLHRINTKDNNGGSLASDLYKRLPQLDLAGNFYDNPGGLNYHIDSGVVNFVHRDDFNTYKPVVAGGRFNVGSGISLPLNWMGAYITPKVQLQATGYSIHDRDQTKVITDPKNNITRVLPIISVDSGVIFSRDIKFFQNNYAQTLEPRLFYLFVPTKNQDNIPVFDTTLPGLDFSQLFRTNRFSGIDRIGDANQATAALTSRFLDDSGQEKLNAGFGQILSIHKHMVNLDGTSDPLKGENLSPLVGQLQYFITPKVNAKAGAAWDPSNQRFNTSSINLQYNDNAERVINFGYNYIFQGDGSTQKPNADLSRVSCSIGWRLWRNWNILGGLDYNISYKRAQTALYGLEYDSCCFALRLVRSQTFVGVGNINYAARTYLQFFLKGLGDPSGYGPSFGGQGGNLNLPGSIAGYNDKRVIGL
ncbi:LPS-assembly protein LptD [Gammaproteobacteria bacterium]